jgi:hypothetical protein
MGMAACSDTLRHTHTPTRSDVQLIARQRRVTMHTLATCNQPTYDSFERLMKRLVFRFVFFHAKPGPVPCKHVGYVRKAWSSTHDTSHLISAETKAKTFHVNSDETAPKCWFSS